MKFKAKVVEINWKKIFYESKEYLQKSERKII